MNKVLHFVRKKSQLKASFIKNQISCHENYQPLIVYRFDRNKVNDGGFADIDTGAYECLDLAKNESLHEKLNFGAKKEISSRQAIRISEYSKTHDVKILHFHYGTDAGIYRPFLQRTCLPSVVSFYGYDCSGFPLSYGGFGRFYLRHRVFPYATKILAMSEDMKSDLKALDCPGEKIIVHYYGTDVRLFKDLKRKVIVKDKTILLILASLVPQKGHYYLFHAIKKLVDRGVRKLGLRVVGTGPLDDDLHDYVRENGLTDYISFIGPVKYSSRKMFQEFKAADIFIHPSVTDTNGDKEGIPGTIVEAMASGLPVISTYHAGIPYIINNRKSGLLVKEWDVDALSNAIETLIGDPELRKKFGETARNYAVKHLDLLDKQKELESIYDQLVKN